MKASLPQAAATSLIAIVTISAVAHGQTIGIGVGATVHVDVDTIPTEQVWVTESPDLANWTNHTFVDEPTRIDCGPPAPDRRFYRLEALYGPITWTQLPDMPVARDQFTGGVIDDKLYVFGGNGDPDGWNLSRLDILDLETGQWARGADYTFGIEELSSAVIGGKLYVFGGYAAGHKIRITLCYDPETDSWAELEVRPTEAQAGTVIAWGQEILALGGMFLDETSHPEVTTKVVEAYHTVTNGWRSVTVLPYRSQQSGVGIYDDVLYVIGGWDRDSGLLLNKICRFDLKAESWLPEIEGTLPHPIFAPYSSACPIVNGKVLMAGGLAFEQGGWNGAGEEDIVLSKLVTAYDIQQNAFSQNGALLQATWQNLFLLGGDRLFLLGGAVGPYGAETRTATIFSGTFGD